MPALAERRAPIPEPETWFEENDPEANAGFGRRLLHEIDIAAHRLA
jgi:hypothetical protein